MSMFESILDAERDESRSARIHQPAWRDGRTVGDRYVDDPDLPDLGREWDEP